MDSEISTIRATGEMVSPPAALIDASLRLPPRDMDLVGVTMRQLACMSTETARASIYCVPVGKDPKTGLQKFKLGESIRMAEICQNAFGRMMVDLQIHEQTDTSVTVKAMMMDLQTLNIYPGIGTGNFKSAGRYKLALAAACSIARRNAILSMCKPYTAAILDDVKRQIVHGLSESGSVKEALLKLEEELKGYQVSREQIKTAVAGEATSADKVVLLIGILNAIRDGAVEAADVFGKPDTSSKSDVQPPARRSARGNPKKDPPPPPPAPASLGELFAMAGIQAPDVWLDAEFSIKNIAQITPVQEAAVRQELERILNENG